MLVKPKLEKADDTEDIYAVVVAPIKNIFLKKKKKIKNRNLNLKQLMIIH